MDKFDERAVIDGLILLKNTKDPEKFGRAHTALKRALTVLDFHSGELKEWRTWLRHRCLEEKLPLQFTKEHFLAFVRLFDDPIAGLQAVTEFIATEPYTQSKAILLHALETFRNHQSPEVQTFAQQGIDRILEVNDPVLNFAATNLKM
jgi:hypothetical protein